MMERYLNKMTKEPEIHVFINDLKRESKLRGWLLAHTSSETPAKPIWTEYKIFKTISGNYIILTYGVPRSGINKELRVKQSEEITDPLLVKEALLFKNKEGISYLNPAGQEALQQAIENDDELKEAFDDNVIS